jgi:hypothetical protein
MAIDNTKAFRLTVWRPLARERRIAFEKPDSAGDRPLLPADSLYEAIYEWQPKIDVWASIETPEVTNELRELISRFDPFEPALNRTIAHLGLFLEKLQEIHLGGGGRWADCEIPADETGDTDVQFRSNTALALHRHLQWVHDTFQHVPGAEITIR